MTRVKKELRKRGAKLECDYDTLPFWVPGCGYAVEGVSVNVEEATYMIYVNVADPIRIRLTRTGMLEAV